MTSVIVAFIYINVCMVVLLKLFDKQQQKIEDLLDLMEDYVEEIDYANHVDVDSYRARIADIRGYK